VKNILISNLMSSYLKITKVYDQAHVIEMEATFNSRVVNLWYFTSLGVDYSYTINV